jgi:hypothetical protein
LNLVHSRLAHLLGGLAIGALATLALAGPAHAESNPNNLDCRGHIEAGDPAPGDDDQQVKYAFACNGPITGYQLQPQPAETGFDPSAVVFDTQGNAVTTDSFSCDGDFPGWGINCIGTYSGNYAAVIGQFSIATKLCAEPRVDPLLTVVYASKDATGNVVQAISGPYDLGRPHGCPPSKRAGRTRIPAGGVYAVDATPKPAKKHKKAKASKKKPAASRA